MLASLLQRTPSLDVVVFSNDDMAAGGVFHCIAPGLTPELYIAMFGFNGLDVGQALPTPLSTILSNRFSIGRVAVEQRLSNRARNEIPQTIDTGLDILESETA